MATTTKPAANAATTESANAANAASKNNHGAEKVKVVIDRVNLVEQDGKSKVYLNFTTAIKGHMMTPDGRIETNVKYIALSTFYLLEQLRESNKLLKRFINRQETITKGMLNDMLTDAEIIMLRTWHAAGEEVTDDDGNIVAFDQDWFSTDIVSVKLDELSIDYIKNN